MLTFVFQKIKEIWNHWQNGCDHARSMIISDRATSWVRGLCSGG